MCLLRLAAGFCCRLLVYLLVQSAKCYCQSRSVHWRRAHVGRSREPLLGGAVYTAFYQLQGSAVQCSRLVDSSSSRRNASSSDGDTHGQRWLPFSIDRRGRESQE